MRRTVLILSLIAVGALVAAGPAAAQGTSSAKPDRAGKGTTLRFAVDGLAPPLDGRLPSALQLKAPGFRTSFKAVAKRCKEQSATLNECPRASRIGKGSLLIEVTAPDGVRDVNVPITVYLNSRSKLLAVAYVFGWRVVPGTIDASGGLTVTFDPLPAGPPFAGVSYRLKSLEFRIGAKRTVTVRSNGRRRSKTVSFLRTPRDCKDGSWASTIALTFPDGSQTPLPAPTSCSG